MLGLLASLFVYCVAATVAIIFTTIEKDKYYKKYRALEDELKKLKSEQPQVQSQPVVQPKPEVQVQQPVQPQPQVKVQAQTQPQAQPVFKPAPVPQAPLPTYSAQPKQRKGGSTAVGVSFSVGVLLMVIAAAVFISATWQTMLPVLKCIVLLLVVSGVYALSKLSRDKLKLESTSSVLYMLGSLITPIAVFVGFLAFDLQKEMITLVCCALSLGVSGLIGYRIFGTKLQVAISYLGFVWSEIFICMEAMGNVKGLAFGICTAAFVSGLIYFIKPKLKFFDKFAEITAYVAVIGFFMTASFGRLTFIPFILSNLMYWASLLMLTRKRKWIAFVSALAPIFTLIHIKVTYVESRTAFLIIAFLTIAFMLALYRLIKHENFVSNAIISVGMSLTVIIIHYCTGYSQSLPGLVHDFMYYTVYLIPLLACGAVYVMSKNSIERAVYMYLVFASAVVESQLLLNDGIVPIIVFLVIAAGAVLINYRFKLVHVKIAACVASVVVFLINFTEGDKELIPILYASASVALYAVVVLMNKFRTVDKLTHISARFSVLPMLIAGNQILMLLTFSDSLEGFIAMIVIDVIFTVLTLIDTDNYFGCLPAVSFMVSVMYRLYLNEVDNAVISLIFVAAYSLIGRFLICPKIISRRRIDWFTLLASVACLVPVCDMSYTLLFLTLYIMLFTGRFGKEGDTLIERLSSRFRLIVSCAICTLTLCLVTLDMEFSSVMDTEIRLMFMLVAALAVYLFIMPCEATRWIWFSVVALCIQIEAFHAMGEQMLLPLTLISVCAVGIFIYSFIFKRRSWFILAIVTIGEFALLFAMVFWDSRLWWIYLLVLGAILIATASVNEYKRRKALESGMEDKKIRLFDDWTW